jgi:hypothetical protein
VIEGLLKQLEEDDALKASAEANPPDNFALAFETVARERMQELADSHFKVYQKFNDDDAAMNFLLGWLLERYRKNK